MTSSKWLLLAAVLLIGGCTYSFRGQSAGAVKSLAIPTFENESAEFGIAERITDELIRGFQRDGTLKVVGSDQADAILKGRILQVEDMPYTASADQVVEEYRFSLTCSIDFIDNKTQQVIWSQSYPVWAIYPYGGTLAGRDQAIQEAVLKLQQDLLNKIVGNW